MGHTGPGNPYIDQADTEDTSEPEEEDGTGNITPEKEPEE